MKDWKESLDDRAPHQDNMGYKTEPNKKGKGVEKPSLRREKED